MNWARVATVFVIAGFVTLGCSLLWRVSLADSAERCREENVWLEVYGSSSNVCPTTTPATIAIVIGLVVSLIGVALAVGASGQNR